MKQTMKPTIDIYMSDMVDAKELAADIYRKGDGIFMEVPPSEIWYIGTSPIEVVLPNKKYYIHRR